MALPSLRPQAGRSIFNLIALAMLSLAVAGCVPRSRPPLQQPPPDQEAPRPDPVEGPSRLPPDETRNRVAVLVPLNGNAAGLGQSLLNAANLALLDTGGERIRITAYDTSRGAAAAANEALADGSGLILGPLLAEDVRVVAPIAARAEVPVIAFSNDISVAGDGVYIIGLNPSQSIDRVVQHARAQGAQRFAALLPTNVYGERAGRAMTSVVNLARGQMVGMQTFDRSAGGLRAAARRLSTTGGYDAVLIADGSRTAAQAAPLLVPRGANVRILGTELWATDTGVAGNAALRGAWFAAPSDAMYEAFRTRYRARYSSDPYRLATLGYDSVLLVMRIAADWRLGRPFPVRALRDRTGFIGVDGAFRFGPDGIAERALEVREVTANGTTVVSPAPRGFQ